jgi:phosphate transport system substrate-binding protein
VTIFAPACAALIVAAVAAGCGSTSTNSNTGTTASAASGFGKQVCGSGAGAKPGYSNPIAKIGGGASSLSGAGSTFVAPIMSIWTKNYATATGVQVAYQSIGSGGGVQQIIAGTVDFGDSDVPMTDAELAQAKEPILHVPVVSGAVVPTYHLSGVGSGLRFDGETLGRIFAGEITRWNDPALVKLNPGEKLPDEPIAVVHRSDGSGTTGVWTDFLTKASPSWVKKLGGKARSDGKTVAWPVGIGGKGNEGVSGQIGQTEGALGYVELQYALSQNLTYGQVKNRAGHFVEPCITTVTKAAEGAAFPPDLRGTLTWEPNPDAYPAAGTTFVLVDEHQSSRAKAAALVNFLSWVLSQGQDQASSVNYAPLGRDLRARAIAQLRKITVNGSPVAGP